MEKVLEQALPEVTKTIEPELPALPVEVENSGFGWPTYGVGIIILAVIAVGLYKNYKNNKK